MTRPLTKRHRLRVRYLGGRPVTIRGAVSRSKYVFSGSQRLQLLDPRDAATMLKSRVFRIEGVVDVGEGGNGEAVG